MHEINVRDREYDVFNMFTNQWGLLCSGTKEHHNAMTISWGSLGSIWGHSNQARSIVTVYVSPARYTYEFMEDEELFTVSFFSGDKRPALAYLGSHSGRDEDKLAKVELTPMTLDGAVGFEEAELSFVCRKIYSDPFDRERTPEDYKNGLYTQIPAHHFYIGEIIKTYEKD